MSRPRVTRSTLVCVSGCQISGAQTCYTSCALLSSAPPRTRLTCLDIIPQCLRTFILVGIIIIIIVVII